MAGVKSGRLAEDIKRIISAEIRELKDPRISGATMLTVVRCEVSQDGSYCKAYISSFDGYAQAKEAAAGLESAKGIIKHEISRVLRLRKCPDIKFIPDNSMEHSMRINKLLKDDEGRLSGGEGFDKG